MTEIQDQHGFGEPAEPAADVDYALVGQIREAVNRQLEEYERTNGSLAPEATRQMASNLIMRELEIYTMSSVSAGMGVMSAQDEIAVRDAVIARMFGMGRIEALLDNPEVEDLYICGSEPVIAKFFGGRKETWPPIAESDEDLINQAMAIATHQGMNERDITTARPFLNMNLPNHDARLAFIFGVTPRPVITIRRHRFVSVQLEHLVRWGTLSRAMMALLQAAVTGHRSILIVGPQSAGKTTMLRALCQCISPTERWATLETEFELLLHTMPERFPLLIAVEERVGSGEKDASGKLAGQITLGDVFPWTLRHSLDRVVVGECRSEEIVSVLRAMSRGYRGSMATFHADSARETFESMASLLIEYAPSLTHDAAMRQIATALDLVVFIDREAGVDRTTGEPTEIRYVTEILEVGPVSSDSGLSTVTEIFKPLEDLNQRAQDPRGYPVGAGLADDGLWARRAGLDLAWLQPEHGAWDNLFPLRSWLDSTVDPDGGEGR